MKEHAELPQAGRLDIDETEILAELNRAFPDGAKESDPDSWAASADNWYFEIGAPADDTDKTAGLAGNAK